MIHRRREWDTETEERPSRWSIFLYEHASTPAPTEPPPPLTAQTQAATTLVPISDPASALGCLLCFLPVFPAAASIILTRSCGGLPPYVQVLVLHAPPVSSVLDARVLQPTPLPGCRGMHVHTGLLEAALAILPRLRCASACA